MYFLTCLESITIVLSCKAIIRLASNLFLITTVAAKSSLRPCSISSGEIPKDLRIIFIILE